MGQITFKTGTITFKGGTVTFKNAGQVATPTVTNVYWEANKLYYTVVNNDFESVTLYTRVAGGAWTNRGTKSPSESTGYNQNFPDPGIPGYSVIIDAYATVSGRQDSAIGYSGYVF